MSKQPNKEDKIWKEPNAALILKTVRNIPGIEDKIESMYGTLPDNTIFCWGDDLPGCFGSVVTAKELEDAASTSAPFELWWCRVIAKQIGLNVPYMDWFYHNYKLNMPEVYHIIAKYKVDDEIDEHLITSARKSTSARKNM
jgi:hypothetical protein